MTILGGMCLICAADMYLVAIPRFRHCHQPLGLGTNWVTAITNTVSLSVGLTYDYYTVSDADAKTYLNGSYYDSLYAAREKAWTDAGKSLDDILDPTNGDPVAINIKELESQCSGWTCTAENEVKSFYKSMGIRVGINAKF